MIKKKSFDIKKLMFFGGIPTVIVGILGFMISSSKAITVYAELPKEVSEVKQEVEKVDEYIKEQRMQNRLMQKMVSQRDEVIYSPDGKQYFDKDEQKWKKVKHE